MGPAARVLFGCCVLSCVSCADTLGLHDLSQADDAGSAEGDRTQWIDGGADSGVSERGPVDGGHEAKAETGAAPPADRPVTIEGDAASDGVDDGPDAAGSKPPQFHDSGSSKLPQADAAGIDDAAPKVTDGAVSVCGACGSPGCTVHSNGVGQTFDDCQPLGTYNETQALAACAAFTGSIATCGVVTCAQSGGPGGGAGGQANAMSDQAVCSTGATGCPCWTFSGMDVGHVQSANPMKCDPCSKGGGGSTWN
jgi:hypothetical protein